MSGIVAFLVALPRILALMEQIGQWILDKKLNAWLDDVENTIDQLEKAQTAEQKRAAAKSLVGIIRNIR